jgi:glycosyltransferase involved in cell wall biosynthesis
VSGLLQFEDLTNHLMSFQPFVSVVIPTYNRTQSTVAAIESVLAQGYRNFEIVVVDDGSTDGSSESIQQFVRQRARGSETIRYFCQPNQGPSAARNQGIKQARGEYIAFLDSDDVWLPDKLEWQVRALEQFKGECGACFTDARYVNRSGMDIGTFQLCGRHFEQTIGIDHDAVKLLAKSFSGFWISTLIARADLARQVDGFDPEVSFAEDRDFLFRLSLITPFAYVNKELVSCDRNSSPADSDCRPWDKVEVRLRGHQRMYEKWLSSRPVLPADIRRIILEVLRGTYCNWANWHLKNERYGEARQAISRAMMCGLTPRVTVKWALTWLAPTLTRRLSGTPAPYL